MWFSELGNIPSHMICLDQSCVGENIWWVISFDMLLYINITYTADLLSLLWKIIGEMEILEHMKVLKGKGNECHQENKPPATKVRILIVLKYLAFTDTLSK